MARYFYRPKGKGVSKSRKRKVFRKVGFCFKTMWYNFLEDCGPRPTTPDGRELTDDELENQWEPTFPRVPLEHLVCYNGRNAYTHVDLNMIGHHSPRFTAFYYAAFEQSPTEAHAANSKGEIKGIATMAGRDFNRGMKLMEFYGMPPTKPAARIRLIDLSKEQDREISLSHSLVSVMSTRNLQDYVFRSSYKERTANGTEIKWFESCRPFNSAPAAPGDIPKQKYFDEECVNSYYNYLVEWHHAAEFGNMEIRRADNTALSLGWPGDIQTAWQLQASGTPADGLDEKTGLSKIFYDENGHEINKNALQMFRGTPFQVDYPAFFSPVFGWIMFGTNLDTGEVVNCGKQCQ